VARRLKNVESPKVRVNVAAWDDVLVRNIYKRCKAMNNTYTLRDCRQKGGSRTSPMVAVR